MAARVRSTDSWSISQVAKSVRFTGASSLPDEAHARPAHAPEKPLRAASCRRKISAGLSGLKSPGTGDLGPGPRGSRQTSDCQTAGRAFKGSDPSPSEGQTLEAKPCGSPTLEPSQTDEFFPPLQVLVAPHSGRAVHRLSVRVLNEGVQEARSSSQSSGQEGFPASSGGG